MKTFDVQGIEILAKKDVVFAFVCDPRNLPRWAHAFQSVADGKARLVTPDGTVEIVLRTDANEAAGTIDWRLEFPDQNVALAQSRVTETTRGTCIYSFVLHAPPVPLEAVEGALERQITTLRGELAQLKSVLE
jgi:hypothetical protein